MSCEHEHGHDHGDHSHGDGHDHSHDLEPALQSNLYKQIQFDRIHTLNEAEARSGASIVQKAWTERLSDSPILESDADEQLLMHIPYAWIFSSLASLLTSMLDSLALASSTPSSSEPRTHPMLLVSSNCSAIATTWTSIAPQISNRHKSSICHDQTM